MIAGLGRFLVGALAAGGLLCLSTYTLLAFSDSKWLHRTVCTYWQRGLERTFLLCAAATFVVCMFLGLDSLLGFVFLASDDWPRPLAASATFFVAVPLVAVIARASESESEIAALRARIEVLERARVEPQA
jgi:hypothetical protein